MGLTIKLTTHVVYDFEACRDAPLPSVDPSVVTM